MISIYPDENDPVRFYGFEHFIAKSGLKTSDSNIAIVHGGKKVAEKYTIRVARNEMSHRIEGAIHFENDAIPVFETPVKINSKGEALASFSNGTEDYPVIVDRGDEIEIGFDIFNEVGHILSGFLERYWQDYTRTSAYLAVTPVADLYEHFLYNCIEKIALKNNTTLQKAVLWPDEMDFALGLSHDVDIYMKTHQYVSHFLSYLKQFRFRRAGRQIVGILGGSGSNPYWNVNTLASLEKSLGVKSTFFFLNYSKRTPFWNFREKIIESGISKLTIPQVRDSVKTLSDNGWDIGAHTSFDYRDKSNSLMKEKTDVEKITGKNVVGVRQHYLKIDIPEYWVAEEDAGFKYDSTLGFNSGFGFRAGTCFPFRAFDINNKKELNIVEIPLTIMEREIYSEGLEPWETCKMIIDTVRKHHGVLTILWHQRFFNEKEFPGYTELYEKIIRYCKNRGAWVTSLDDIYKWWSKK